MRYAGLIKHLAIAWLTAILCLPARASSTETHQLGFKLGSSRLDTLYNNNAGACARIFEVLAQSPSTRISINSYSSPDGKTSRNRQLARQRAESVKNTILTRIPGLDPAQIVINMADEDWSGVKNYLQRSHKEWKDEALAIIEAQEGDKKALLQDLWVGEAWEDLMKNCFPELRRVTVQLIPPPLAENAPTEASSGISATMLHFGNGGSSIRKNFLSNASGLEELKEMARSAAPELYIYVKSSPEGEESANERLGNRRGKAIEKLLRQSGYTGTVQIIYQGEDWEGLAKAVEASTDVPDKKAILDILADDQLSRNARKKALQALSYGKTWLRLLDVEMSGLRSAVITDAAI